jgi:hypothetical protein
MAEDIGDRINEGKLDLVPMIDCIMLLLLFFILTSKFSSEEKTITSMLPTDKGQAATASTKPVEPPKQINLCIWPAGLPTNVQPEVYTSKLRELYKVAPGGILQDANIRVGGDAPRPITGSILARQGDEELKVHIDQIHQYVSTELEKREKADAASRKDQFPVVIHCFSGLSWKFPLVAYDAVRDYERRKGGAVDLNDPRALEKQREVDFAPPRIRNYSPNEQGNELYEIINLLK